MGARDELHGHDPGPPSRSSSALKKSPAGCGRTGCLPCLDRKHGYSGATVQQIVGLRPFADSRWIPAPQIVVQLPDVLRFFRALSPDPEQVIEVPTFLPEDVSLRTAVREPQLVETAEGSA